MFSTFKYAPEPYKDKPLNTTDAAIRGKRGFLTNKGRTGKGQFIERPERANGE